MELRRLNYLAALRLVNSGGGPNRQLRKPEPTIRTTQTGSRRERAKMLGAAAEEGLHKLNWRLRKAKQKLFSSDQKAPKYGFINI